jgi:quinohemoprotein ethanol dehydrogenase
MTVVRKVYSVVLALLSIGITGAGYGAASATAPASTGAAGVDQVRLNNAQSEPQNWLEYGGTYAEQRYSTLEQISAANIGRLHLAWSYEFDTNRGQEATPLVVDGVLYTSSAWSKVFAIDAKTGRELWHFDPQVPGGHAVYACCDVVNRGVAVWKGKVFVGTIDGRLIAVDAATGKPIWSVATTDTSKPYTITGAPRVFKNKVIIGNGGADLGGVRGYVTAYDTETGKQLWRFYTVPGDPAKSPDHAASDPAMAKAVKTWAGHWYDYGGGGTVWDSMVYDPELDQLYIGVGNGGPWSRKVRSEGKGDNLFLASIVALDPDTGAYRWHYQSSPGDSWDYTNTQPMMLATLAIDGKPRKVLMQAPKNGFFYVLDRTNGKLISAQNFVPVTWAKRIDLATGRPVFADNAYYDHGPQLVMPSSLGAHSWHPMSYSPRTGLVYIPIMQLPLVFAQNPDFHYVQGRWAQAVAVKLGEDFSQIWGALIAWDPVRQKEVWRVPQPEMWNGGALSTASDLVFAGNAHGEFNAYRGQDGTKLWSFKQPAAIMAGPISFSAAGEQYIAVLAGAGGAGPLGIRDLNRPQQAQPMGRVLAFKLGGTATLPTYDLALPPANPPHESFPSEEVQAGAALFFPNCYVCHGGSVLPDLRRSAALTDKAAWNQIVIGGVLSSQGMASFAHWLKPEEVESIRAYVAEDARALEKETAAK